MANLVHDFVKESTSTTGTGTVTLTEVSGFARFSEAFSEGDTVYYTIQDGNDRETGIGTIGAGNTLARTTVHTTLVSGTFDDTSPSAISLSGTNCFVYCSTTKQFFDLKLDNLDAVSEVVNTGTIVDVFIYDVSKDHNPNWVNECGHTSWYNETLNTATRGKTKAFPKVALIVAESDTVTIYDATDSSLPMWMVFNAGSGLSIAGGVNPLVSIKMLNGILYSASSGTGAVSTVNFIDDSSFWRINSASLYYPHNGLVTRDDSISTVITGYFSEPLSDRDFNALAVTTDPSTGKNIVFVGSDGGLDRIDTSDNSVSSWTDDGNGVDSVYNIGIIGDYVYWSTDSYVANKYILSQPINSALVDSRYASTSYFHYSFYYGGTAQYSGYNATMLPLTYEGTSAQPNDFAHNAFASDRGLSLIKPNYTAGSEGSSLICTITGGDNAFTSGWLYGDIKGAWLGDTSTDSLSGTDLVNESFSTDVADKATFDSTYADWTSPTGQLISTSSGVVSVDRNSASYDHLEREVTTVAGLTYLISFEITAVSNTVDCYVQDEIGSGNLYTANETTTGVKTSTFIAIDTTVYVRFAASGATTATFSIKDITITQATPDMSYNNNGLKAVGSITKSAVASGAEMTCASGFSSSNYFVQPYNADMVFAAADAFTVMGWFKTTTDATSQCIIDFGELVTGKRRTLQVVGTTGELALYIQGSNTIGSSTTDVGNGNWHHFVLTNDGADAQTIYIDGVSYATATLTMVDMTSAETLRVGYSINSDAPFDGSIALPRISGGTPTATQIQFMYESEKHLFRDGAEFSTSALDINDLGYDESTKTLYEISDSGWTARHDGQIVKYDSGSGGDNDAGTSIDAEAGFVIKGI
jgi:hypothetical protein